VTIVVDPAHGGPHKGVVGPAGTAESDLNLRVALRLRLLLEGFPLQLQLTRDTDAAVPKSVRHQHMATADWAIQLHHGGVSQREPIEIWISPRANKETAALAKVILGEMESGLGLDGRVTLPPDAHGRPTKQPKFPLFKRAPQAILVSTGHLHTPKGEQAISDQWIQHETGALFRSLVGWLGL